MNETNSLVIFTKASQMLAEADTIQIIERQDKSNQDIAGVYAIFHKTQCIYIGESSNIKRRLSQHDHRGWFYVPHVQLFWFQCNNRKYIEKKLIELCQPLLNGSGAYKHYAALSEAQGKPCEWAPRYLAGHGHPLCTGNLFLQIAERNPLGRH